MRWQNEQHEALSFIRMVQQALSDKGVPANEINNHLADTKKRYRRDLRLANKRIEGFEFCEEYIIDRSDEYGGRYTHIYKITAPSREYMRDYIESEIRRVDSPYDCLGQWFTTDIRFAHMQGDTYLVKHSLSMDV